MFILLNIRRLNNVCRASIYVYVYSVQYEISRVDNLKSTGLEFRNSSGWYLKLSKLKGIDILC